MIKIVKQFLRVAEPLIMGDDLRDLHRKAKVGQRFVVPVVKKFLLREPVKGVVDLNGVEMLRIVFKPFFLR